MRSATSPDAAANEMRSLIAMTQGHALHRAVDGLMCRLMREHGYGEAVDVFESAVAGYHDAARPYPMTDVCSS